MSTWIESVMDLMTVGGGSMSFSLSDARFLMPNASVFWILALPAGFWFLCAFDNIWSGDGQEHKKSDIDSK